MANKRRRRVWPQLVAAALMLFASCRDRLVGPAEIVPDGQEEGMLPVGVVSITLSAIGSDHPTASVSTPEGLSLGLTRPANADLSGSGNIQLEQVSTSSFTEGTAPGVSPALLNAQRYVTATFRVRNAQTSAGNPAYNTPRTNLTFIAIRTATSKQGSAVSQMRKFDNTLADTIIARDVVPTGAVVLDDSLKMKSVTPDVLQIFTEAEVAAIPLPAGVTGVFPYGFVTRNPNNPNSRTMPANPGPNQWDGLVTFAFRIPLQPLPANDVYSVTLNFLAVDDSETRVTESIEEQDADSQARAKARAQALGATTVTVLNGSPAVDPAVPDYPGQRQICFARVADPPSLPTRTINAPGAYTRLAQYYSGESMDACAANFRTGTPARPTLTVPFPVTVRAMDRYGNLKTTAADTITMTTTDGSAAVLSPATALSGGQATLQVTYNSYGGFTNLARGRRRGGLHPVGVSGAARTWTGAVSTEWENGNNWSPAGGTPGTQDTAIIPGDLPRYPVFDANYTIGGITMTPGASVQPTINISAFDCTLTSSMDHGSTGTITGTGRMRFTGVAKTIGGGVSNVDYRQLRIETGASVSLNSNLNVTGGRIVVQGGRLRSTGLRIRVRP
jgi:hypothetical protein